MDEQKFFTIEKTSEEDFKQDFGIDVYSVKAGNVTVFDIFNKSDDLAFVWNGVLDIARIEETALDEVSERLFGTELRINSSNPGTLQNIKAYLIYTEIEGQTEIGEYHLDNLAEYGKYRELISNIAAINFVRFDVLRPPMAYYVTTTTRREVRQEAAIRLSNKSFFSPEVIKWVLEHHNEREEIEQQGMNAEGVAVVAKAIADIVL